jgi:hypothetical protein
VSAETEDFVFGPVTVISTHIDEREEEQETDSPESEERAAESATSAPTMSPQNLTDVATGATPSVTTPMPTGVPTTSPPTVQSTMQPTTSPTVTPAAFNLTFSSGFSTLDISAFQNATFKETFEEDYKNTLSETMPGVAPVDIDIVKYRVGSVVVREMEALCVRGWVRRGADEMFWSRGAQVESVIQLKSQELMEALVTAVKSPTSATMLAPMTTKGYGNATVMTETMQVRGDPLPTPHITF